MVDDRLVEVEPETIEAGDIVDIPVWMDMWFGGGGITVQPWTFVTFDRLVIVEKGTKVSKTMRIQTTQREAERTGELGVNDRRRSSETEKGKQWCEREWDGRADVGQRTRGNIYVVLGIHRHTQDT